MIETVRVAQKEDVGLAAAYVLVNVEEERPSTSEERFRWYSLVQFLC